MFVVCVCVHILIYMADDDFLVGRGAAQVKGKLYCVRPSEKEAKTDGA